MTRAAEAWLGRPLPARVLRWEAPALCFACWLFFVSVPLLSGELALGWDALNHHIYLGWSAEHPRFDHDYLAAGYQSYQAPWLYWPVYKMAAAGWSGRTAGVVLASLHVLAVWPVWMLARAVVPGVTLSDAAMRTMAVLLGLASSILMSALDSSMNDVLASVPLLWSFALALEPAREAQGAAALARRYVIASGLLAGLAVAAKLSNGPLAVLMPALWWFGAQRIRERLVLAALGSLSAALAFVAAYGPWATMLWRHFSNPLYPFYGHWFVPVRAWLGWILG